MVRLKAKKITLAELAETMFQFQNGTIKRIAPKAVMNASDMFQFQNGTIKSRHST